ncbi:dethiobiotin synthase [Streptomyces sp. ISID311]|uniref:dethiobiotin synthase n=1 Tax=Streptomyces sp. ISID311 TaxID=2601673 RepID=UPI00321198CE
MAGGPGRPSGHRPRHRRHAITVAVHIGTLHQEPFAVLPWGRSARSRRHTMSVLFVTGTGTEIGKTVTTAAIAAAALARGRSVAVLKPAQTGVTAHETGDAAEVERLAGPVTTLELARFPDPLAPATAALRAGLPPVLPQDIAEAAAKLAASHDLVLVEGAGGLLVRFDADGHTLADAARLAKAPVLVVAQAGLGTLNATALTALALRSYGLDSPGVVIGSWPAAPDLAARCNLTDLPDAAGAPLLGLIPEHSGALAPDAFRAAAPGWLAPALGGSESFRIPS